MYHHKILAPDSLLHAKVDRMTLSCLQIVLNSLQKPIQEEHIKLSFVVHVVCL